MAGLIALVGGDEFRPECEPMDRALLSRFGKQPRVIVLPTAAARENPMRAADNGVRYFRSLGARADAVMITNASTARETELVWQIKNVDMVYFTGGDPVHLLETMRGSPAWDAARQVVEAGGTLAGSSAGAMICGGQLWAPGEGWREGLGLVPNIALLPHHATLAARWNADRMKEALPRGVTLVGIDAATALVGAGSDWGVTGAGEVVVYRSDPPSVFSDGQYCQWN